ncbi:MAG: hemerythrin domain-containing protein [Deltaproteobacteria bacterium]|nr:hemerythrin domain-containing protein [Deltaproteobacteria bacterium]
MSDKVLEIRYTCHHPSCVVHCKNGILFLTESEYAQLAASYEDPRYFKSPRHACRMGYSQQFEALSIEVAEDENALGENEELSPVTNSKTDPIAALISEHQKILEMADKVDAILTKRNIDELWVSTAELDNMLHLHSGIKEEEVLFPALRGLVPFGEGLVACIQEDHREIVSLIYSFREALRDGTINDKIIGSALVALRSHVRKEDNEFFEFIRKYITEEMKESLMKGMRHAEHSFVPAEPGERKPDEEKADERAKFHKKAIESKEIACDSCCH